MACGDSTEDCEETQTCIDSGENGGEAGGGNGGTTSGASGTAGNAGSGGDSGGASGTGTGGGTGGSGGAGNGQGGDSGAAGAGTGGEDGDPAPTVVSVTIGGGTDTVDVDVYDELVIEFSEAISEDTLTTDSISIVVAGHTIAGEVTVDDATHATFTPLERYWLTAEHTLTVTTDVTDTGGTALEQDYALDFTVRDGAWTHMPTMTPAPLPNTDEQMKAAVAVDGQGNILVAWAKRPPVDGMPGWFYARWYRQGSGWEPVTTLSSSLSICPVSCVPVFAAVNQRGDAVVATASGSNLSVYQYRNGAWGSVMALEAGQTPPRYTALGMSEIGEAHVMTHRSEGAQTGLITTRHTTASGTWRPVEETDTTTAAIDWPGMAFDADGNGVAVWPVGTGPYRQVYSVYTQASGTWSAPTELPRSTADGVGRASLALRPEGDGIVSWLSFEGSSAIIRAVNYSRTTFPDVQPTMISATGGNASQGPAVAFDGQDFVAVWNEFGGTESNSAWLARRSGGAWDGPDEIGPESGRYAPPALGADVSGNLMVLLRVPSLDSYEVPYFTRFRASSPTWRTPSILLDEREYRDDPAPALAVSRNGVAAGAISYFASTTEFLFDTSVVIFQ
jgi:hypothetical protein